MSRAFLHGGNPAVSYSSPSMRQPEVTTPSKLHLPQRPGDIYIERSRRSSLDSPTFTTDKRRARDFIADRTTTDSTNGFPPGRSAPPELPPTSPTRSNYVSSSEEGEVSEDEAMEVDATTAPPSATGQATHPEINSVPGDNFSLEQKNEWYQGRSADEPARPGVLDDSMTVADYVEAQLLVLDLLGWGVPPEDLFRGFGISPTLLTTIFNDLQLRLPKDLNLQEPPSSFQGQGEAALPSPPPSSSLGVPPSIDADGPVAIAADLQPSPRVSPSPPNADSPHNPIPHQTESSSGETSVAFSSGEELLNAKSELLRAQLQKRKLALQAMSATSSASETLATALRISPQPVAPPTIVHESVEGTNTTAPDPLSLPSPPIFTLPPKPDSGKPVGNILIDTEALGLPPRPPSVPRAVSMEAVEPSTPPSRPSSDQNDPGNHELVITTGDGQEVPARKRTKLDLLLREKLAKVKAKEAVASRSKSPSVPPSQPPQISSTAGTSETNIENPPPSHAEHSTRGTTEDAGGPPARPAFQPTRSTTSKFSSYDVPSTSTPVALDYGLPSPIPEVSYVKPPTRSYSYDSRSGSRLGKRLRATDFIDDNEVSTFLPMLDPYAKVIIDISEDEDEVEEHLRVESPVDTPSDDAQDYSEPRVTDSVEPGEPASADAFLGSLMDELVDSNVDVDPSDEIKRLKAKIAAMEAMHKKRIMQQGMSSRQTSVDPIVQDVSVPEAETATSTTPEVEDRLATGVISIDAGDEADVEDEAEDDDEDDRPHDEAEAEAGRGTIYAVDEDGDQNMLDANNAKTKTMESLTGSSPRTVKQLETDQGNTPRESMIDPVATSSISLPSKAAVGANSGSQDRDASSMFASSTETFDIAEFAIYQNPIGWYDTASNHPLASSHTIQHSQGVLDLMPLRAQALARYDPNKQLCQYEVPGGGTCLDPTCGDCHVRDTLPTDEETAKYLANVFPGLDTVQIRASLLGARKSGSSQGFTTTVAETLRLLGLR